MNLVEDTELRDCSNLEEALFSQDWEISRTVFEFDNGLLDCEYRILLPSISAQEMILDREIVILNEGFSFDNAGPCFVVVFLRIYNQSERFEDDFGRDTVDYNHYNSGETTRVIFAVDITLRELKTLYRCLNVI